MSLTPRQMQVATVDKAIREAEHALANAKSSAETWAKELEKLYAMRGATGELTPRQMEVVKLMAEGHNAESISHQLHISKETVRTLQRQIRERLGVNTELEIVVVYFREQWVPRNPIAV